MVALVNFFNNSRCYYTYSDRFRCIYKIELARKSLFLPPKKHPQTHVGGKKWHFFNFFDEFFKYLTF